MSTNDRDSNQELVDIIRPSERLSSLFQNTATETRSRATSLETSLAMTPLRPSPTSTKTVLIEFPSPLDLQSGWGRLALPEVAKRFAGEVLAVLLGKAANFEVAVIDLGKIWHDDVLHVAAQRVLDGLVKLLLENGADPDLLGKS